MHSVYEPAASSCIPCMNLLPGHVLLVYMNLRSAQKHEKAERIFIQLNMYVHYNERRTTRLPDTTHRTLTEILVMHDFFCKHPSFSRAL